MRKRLWTMTVLAVVVMLLVAACSSSSASPTPAGGTPTGGAPTPAATGSAAATGTPAATATAALAPAVPKVPTGYTELDKALGADQPFKGMAVSIQTQWIGGEGANFAASVADFATATGIKIQVDSIGSSHETVLKTRIEGGSPPDLAMLAQPTGVLAYADEGKLIDVSSFMDVTKLNNEHKALIGTVTKNGKIWGVPYKADVKSTVWYPIKAFAAKGYQVPTTWDQLIALSDQIVKDGSNPWCIGIGAGDATGWQATDWVEEVVLKTKGIDYYNQWINHTVTFEDQGIKDALDKYVGKIFFTPNYVFGGNTAIINTPQTQPMDPMFNQDMAAPGCWMQKIPTWYGPDFFPDQRTSGQPSKFVIGTDVGIFYFPTIDPAQGTPSEGSADTLMVTAKPDAKNLDAVKAVAEFLSTPEGTENWIRAGSAISANQTTPPDWYAGSYKLKVAADIVAKSNFIGFDASDLMPAAVGAGTFWTKMVDWINNNGSNTDAVLKAIDDSWPTQ